LKEGINELLVALTVENRKSELEIRN